MCASSCFGAMSDETDVRPGVGGAVRYGYVILTTYHTYLDLSSITDTGYFGYYSITHTIVCVILAKKQYHISIHGYYNVHGTPGCMRARWACTALMSVLVSLTAVYACGGAGLALPSPITAVGPCCEHLDG